ncbi:hypothetical protein HJFPF1_05425 [Paramyrothecium foliicola]|nr:hypothetical protein HJFPF1_05425 [Paramyrothecium foliicola]
MFVSMATPTVFVTGLTQPQGYALAHHLCALGWMVKATVGNLETPKARALSAAGAHLTLGEWDDDEALIKTLGGCEKLFLSLPPQSSSSNSPYRQGEKIVKIAKIAGVRQVVVSTTLDVAGYSQADTSHNYEHLNDAVTAVETLVQTAGFQYWTIIHPALRIPSMLNHTEFPAQVISHSPPMHEYKALLTDPGLASKIAVAALRNADKFHGRTLGLSSELLSSH